MTDRFEYILFVGFSYLFRLCGLKISRRFSTILAFVFFYIIPIRKETTIDNLTKAFPEYTHAQIKKIAFNSYKSFATALIEILYLPWIDEKSILNIAKFEGVELTRKKHEEGKGVILLAAHFGNWEYSGIAGGLTMQIPFSIIIKPQRNILVSDWLNKMRTRWGNEVIPLGISIRQVYKALKDGKIVAMAADQRGSADGIRVNFFGRKAAVYPGPAILALKTWAPIFYGVSVRQPDNSYIIKFEEVDTKNLPESEEEKIVELSQRLTDYLENIVRKYPEQWLWMHKRWKY